LPTEPHQASSAADAKSAEPNKFGSSNLVGGSDDSRVSAHSAGKLNAIE